MSRENPDGWKLEELLEQIRFELGEKNELLRNDECVVSTKVRLNNSTIMLNLIECIALQNHTMQALDELGENQGALGKPRIGN